MRPTFHAARLETCERMKKLNRIFRGAYKTGRRVSGIELGNRTGSIRVSSDVAEYRANIKPLGYDVRYEYGGLSENGRKRSLYRLVRL